VSLKIAKLAKRSLERLDYRLHRAKVSLKGSFSNFNEDRILEKYIRERLPANHTRVAVDIGAGDGIRRSNTFSLFSDGWKGLGVEYDAQKFYKLAKAYRYYPNVFACRCLVTPGNIVSLLEAYEIEQDFSVLNLDIDSYDYWVLDAVLGRFRPRIVMTEINEKIPPPIKFVVKFDPRFQLTHHFFGYSIMSLAELCERHGYALVELEYNNAFLMPREMLGVEGLDAATAYRRGYLERPDRREKFRANEDMEILHSLSPEEGIHFITKFYAQHEGRYEISLAETSPTEAPASVQATSL
jgi:hypothetical protein